MMAGPWSTTAASTGASDDSPHRGPIMSELELDREHVIQALCAHFAHDHLSSQELELRFEHAYRAATSTELRALVAGLPALSPDEVPPAPLFALAPGSLPDPAEKRHL